MRRAVLAGGAAVAAVLASALGSAAANSAVRSSVGSNAVVTSVSCASDGSCAAGGHYLDAKLAGHAFVLTGKNGQWGKAIVVPGLAALKPTGASIESLSCAPAGGCVAAGTFLDASKGFHVFVTSEQNGRWSRPTTILTGKRSSRGIALSCPTTGSCAAGDGRLPFVVSEAHGRWGKAVTLPAANDKLDRDRVVVSCASAGNCSAGWGPFVVTEQNGRWGKAAAVLGLAKLGTAATITSVSCPAAANCAAGGIYLHKGAIEVFVASKRGGRWGQATELPGFTALNTEGFGDLAAVSCVSAGNCVAGGSYAAQADFAGGSFQAFVASERNGRWGKAIEMPGIPAPSSAICEPDSGACVAGQTIAVSCSPGGTCAAGGWFDTPTIDGQAAFVSTYKNGTWAKAVQVPGLAALDTAKNSRVQSVACTPTGSCAAGGSYSTTTRRIDPAFLTFEKNGTWGQAQTVRF
ncbi:MAG TPA: hypothetical protein VFI65_33855 [Streptosporangiaceae bacterium]|nr:hypothetical protein [Streptosporangiaceae bacterium]